MPNLSKLCVAMVLSLTGALISAEATSDNSPPSSQSGAAISDTHAITPSAKENPPLISVISVPVSDPQVAKTFYIQKLGMVLVIEQPMGPGTTWIELAPRKGAPTTIALVTWFPEIKPGSLQGLVLDVSDLASWCAKLKAQGVIVGEIEKSPWGQFADVMDPDGNGWKLHQP